MKQFLCCFVACVLTACGTGGGNNNLPPSLERSTLSSVAGSEAQSDALHLAQATHVPVSTDMLYIGNLGSSSITVYHHDAQGNAAPVRSIAGPNTGITSPGQLSEDAAGNLYVANNQPSSILVFAPNANGNVKPLRVLVGPAPGLSAIGAMTVDQATGKIYVVTNVGTDGGLSAVLYRFPPNASGNEAPFASGPIWFYSLQLANDSTGQNLIDAHEAACCSTAIAGVETLFKQFSNNTGQYGANRIYGLPTFGVADDPTTQTYLATTPYGVYRLVESASGAGPLGTPNGPQPPPPPTLQDVSIISSETCGGQLALGYLRNVYVVHNCGNAAINVYAHDSSGNAIPLRILSGSATKLNQPYGIYEGK